MIESSSTRAGATKTSKESKHCRIRSAKALLLVVVMGGLCFAQAPAETTNAPDNNKAGAYYNFAMGRLYAELAGAYSNRNDYVSKAIQHYQEALKLDPSAGGRVVTRLI